MTRKPIIAPPITMATLSELERFHAAKVGDVLLGIRTARYRQAFLHGSGGGRVVRPAITCDCGEAYCCICSPTGTAP